jgi:hypothetical protein
MSNSIKFCKDCKFFKISLLERLLNGLEYGRCTKQLPSDEAHHEHNTDPYAFHPWFVTGKTPNTRYPYASVMRQFHCRSHAQFFEAKDQ